MSARMKPQLVFQPDFPPALLVMCVLLIQMNFCLSTSFPLLVFFFLISIFNFCYFLKFRYNWSFSFLCISNRGVSLVIFNL